MNQLVEIEKLLKEKSFKEAIEKLEKQSYIVIHYFIDNVELMAFCYDNMTEAQFKKYRYLGSHDYEIEYYKKNPDADIYKISKEDETMLKEWQENKNHKREIRRCTKDF